MLVNATGWTQGSINQNIYGQVQDTDQITGTNGASSLYYVAFANYNQNSNANNAALSSAPFVQLQNAIISGCIELSRTPTLSQVSTQAHASCAGKHAHICIADG